MMKSTQPLAFVRKWHPLGMLIAMLLWWPASQGQTTAPQPSERTRLLLILDCSHSMWDHWQSNAKIKITQQVLLSFLDSLNGLPQSQTEVALRVFGHLNKGQFGTRLEVPFGGDNIYQLQSKIKTLVPQGGCTAAAALTDALGDFPSTHDSRNLILIITDGMADCEAEICGVARQVQLSGVVVQTFVVSIGSRPPTQAECAGPVFEVPHEEDFAHTLHRIFRLSGQKAKVLLQVVDDHGSLYPTEDALSLADHRTAACQLNTLYRTDEHLRPDTLLLDPLVSYDLTLFTHPPLHRTALQFSADSLNRLVVVASEGALLVNLAGMPLQGQQWQVPVVVREAGFSRRVASLSAGEEGRLLAGKYDVEVQTLPPTLFHGVEIRGGYQTELSLPTAGLLQLGKPRGITTGVILRIVDGRAEYVCRLNSSTIAERITLQPGHYEVVLHQQQATAYTQVLSQRFIIESGQTTRVGF